MIVGDRWVPSYLKPNLIYKIGANGHMFTRMQEAQRIKKPDVLILGSSHAYRGYDTRIFKEYGYRAFNLGSSAQTPIQTLTLLLQYLDKIRPETIIYDVNPRMFFSDGVESSLDIIANDKVDKHTIEMAFEVNHIKTYNALIYGIKRDWFNLNHSFEESKIKGNDKYVQGGFVETKMEYYRPAGIKKRAIKFQKNQVKAFEKSIEEIEKRGINLVLVFGPISKELYSSYSNMDDFNSKMKSYAEHYKAKYYNFNKISNLSDSQHFSDEHHLNQKGVKAFNHDLLNSIKP